MMSSVGYDVDFRLVVSCFLECFRRGFTTFYVHPVVVAVCPSAGDMGESRKSLHMNVTGTCILWIRSTIGKRE